MHDIIIRGGAIFDGSGGAPGSGDVAVKDGVIVAVGGAIAEPARQVIDADGAIVTPAFIDIHTHYDGQATWDAEMNPSASHGVGTIVMGNCGVGFAPVPRGGQRQLIELMEGVEDIPGTALYEGMPWGAWETYPEYLDYLATRGWALDVSSMIAHGPVRNYVMGPERANAPATGAEVARMAALVEEALRAGAVGFSTSRIMAHRSIHGDQVPGTFAEEAELAAIAAAMGRAGAGVLQAIPSGTLGAGMEHSSLESEVEMLCRLSRSSGRPSTFTLFETMQEPALWREVIGLVKAGNAAGARVHPQVGARPTGLVFSLGSYHPFMAKPSYLALKSLPLAERARAMRDPALKAAIMAETSTPPRYPGTMESLIVVAPLPMQQTFPLTSASTYEPTAEESFEARAKAAGAGEGGGWSAFYDHLAQGDGRDFAITFFTGYANYSLDAAREMQLDEATVTGLSDGGAHVGLIFDAVSPTYQLTYWARDRRRGATLPLAHVVNRQTRRNAELFGFTDRGLVAPGMRADLNVIDFDNLKLGELSLHDDLPAGGSRLLQGASGYLATLVAGVLTRRNDQDTTARPGRLVRSRAMTLVAA
ncbi:MAG TPA: amidohydrolase family protein [Caulobacteraceae bacterium]|jgi:N-acyl-D-aspartate/D-glutamate deacylase|nr:amidohydrolase family protein [Caulobacteraceae bacterium]